MGAQLLHKAPTTYTRMASATRSAPLPPPPSPGDTPTESGDSVGDGVRGPTTECPGPTMFGVVGLACAKKPMGKLYLNTHSAQCTVHSYSVHRGWVGATPHTVAKQTPRLKTEDKEREGVAHCAQGATSAHTVPGRRVRGSGLVRLPIKVQRQVPENGWAAYPESPALHAFNAVHLQHRLHLLLQHPRRQELAVQWRIWAWATRWRQAVGTTQRARASMSRQCVRVAPSERREKEGGKGARLARARWGRGTKGNGGLPPPTHTHTPSAASTHAHAHIHPHIYTPTPTKTNL